MNMAWRNPRRNGKCPVDRISIFEIIKAVWPFAELHLLIYLLSGELPRAFIVTALPFSSRISASGDRGGAYRIFIAARGHTG